MASAKVTIQIEGEGYSLTLTQEQARELHDVLSSVLGRKSPPQVTPRAGLLGIYPPSPPALGGALSAPEQFARGQLRKANRPPFEHRGGGIDELDNFASALNGLVRAHATGKEES